MPVAVEACKRGEDVVGRVGDQRRVVVREHGSVLLDEAEKVRH